MRNHDEIVDALACNIVCRIRHKGTQGTRYTASYFPAAWRMHAPVYHGYRWGIFYDNRCYSLMKRWPLALAKVRVSPWANIEAYKAWRDAQQELPEPVIPAGALPIDTHYWTTTDAAMNPFDTLPRCRKDMSGLLYTHGGAVTGYHFLCARCAASFAYEKVND